MGRRYKSPTDPCAVGTAYAGLYCNALARSVQFYKPFSGVVSFFNAPLRAILNNLFFTRTDVVSYTAIQAILNQKKAVTSSY
jgi:hypothetical protein